MTKHDQADMNADHPVNDVESADMDKAEQPEKKDETGEQQVLQESAETVSDTENQAENTSHTKKSQEDEITMLKKKLEEKETALTELSDKYMRLAAEYDNFRRRSQKEKESVYTDAAAAIVKRWLPLLDNLDRAEFVSGQYEHEDARKVCEGIQMIQKQADEVLSSMGIEEIECRGQPFDPELHDAVMHVEDDQYDASSIVEVLQKGYRLRDRIIRHAMVKVAN